MRGFLIFLPFDKPTKEARHSKAELVLLPSLKKRGKGRFYKGEFLQIAQRGLRGISTSHISLFTFHLSL